MNTNEDRKGQRPVRASLRGRPPIARSSFGPRRGAHGGTPVQVFVLSALALLFLPLAAFAQGSDRVVKAKGYASVDGVRPGDKFNIAVAIEVGEGYHINAHHPSLDFLIPITVKFEPGAGISIAPEKYPAPKHRKFEFWPDAELAVHEGTLFITA